MTDGTARVASASITAFTIALYIGVLLYLSSPRTKARLQRAMEWARYYSSLARRQPKKKELPGWFQEALQVRGHGAR
jgi:hypothetical protein